MDKKHVFEWAWTVFWACDSLPITKPELIPEFKFYPGRLYRADYTIADYPILIEVNGGTSMKKSGHNTWYGIQRDYRKLALASANGYYSFWFTPQMLETDPLRCIQPIYDCIRMIDRQRGKRIS